MSAELTADYHVIPAEFRAHYANLKRVREPVFIVEQNVPSQLEWDAVDAVSWHMIALDRGDNPVGTGRLTPEGKLGRIAVLREWRGRGVGKALVHALLDRARALRMTEVELETPVALIEYFLNFGFEPFGDEFDRGGVFHVPMRRALALVPQRRTSLIQFALNAVETFEEAQRAAIAVIANSRRDLCVFSRDLDYALLSSSTVTNVLRIYATSGVDVHVRVLLLEPHIPPQVGHAWLGLAQRLPSIFEFRACEEDPDRQNPTAFMVGDRGALYYRPLGGRLEGEASDDAAPRARQLMEAFDRMWQRGRPIVEYRVLGI